MLPAPATWLYCLTRTKDLVLRRNGCIHARFYLLLLTPLLCDSHLLKSLLVSTHNVVGVEEVEACGVYTCPPKYSPYETSVCYTLRIDFANRRTAIKCRGSYEYGMAYLRSIDHNATPSQVWGLRVALSVSLCTLFPTNRTQQPTPHRNSITSKARSFVDDLADMYSYRGAVNMIIQQVKCVRYIDGIKNTPIIVSQYIMVGACELHTAKSRRNHLK